MKYKVYFELYGKKFQTEIDAKSELEAQCFIRNKVDFHKIEKVDGYEDLMKDLKDSPLGDIFKNFK